MIEKQQIIISYYRQGLSMREIARMMKLNRKTVKRYIKGYQKERQEGYGVMQAPSYDSSNRGKKKLTKAVTDAIDQVLRMNAIKRSQGQSKQCMAGTDIHEFLVASGHQLSYRTVIRYIQERKASNSEVFIRQQYKPGHDCEFDWGNVVLKIGGKIKHLMLAIFTLCYSNYRWAMLFYREDMPSFLDAHVKYLDSIGGVPFTMIYDNMKVAVARYAIRNVDKKPTEDLLKISTYYQFNYRFCNARRGNEKGHVEKSVGYVRRKAFSQVCEFDTLRQANEHLATELRRLNNKSVKGQSKSIIENFELESQSFASLPGSKYEISIVARCKIDKYHTIQIDTNHYSVPEQIQSQVANVKIYPTSIQILDAKNNVAADHERKHAKGQWIIDINHYWKSLRKKPGALQSSVALNQADELIRHIFKKYFQARPRDFIEIISYCRTNQIALRQLETTLEKNQRICLDSTPNCEKIVFMLQESQRQEKPPSNQNAASESMSTVIAEQCTQQLQQIQNLILSQH